MSRRPECSTTQDHKQEAAAGVRTLLKSQHSPAHGGAKSRACTKIGADSCAAVPVCHGSRNLCLPHLNPLPKQSLLSNVFSLAECVIFPFNLTCRLSSCCIFSLTQVGGRRPAVAGALGLPQGLTPPRVHGGVTATQHDRDTRAGFSAAHSSKPWKSRRLLLRELRHTIQAKQSMVHSTVSHQREGPDRRQLEHSRRGTNQSPTFHVRRAGCCPPPAHAGHVAVDEAAVQLPCAVIPTPARLPLRGGGCLERLLLLLVPELCWWRCCWWWRCRGTPAEDGQVRAVCISQGV